MMNYFKLLFSRNSLLRQYQINYIKNYKLIGNSIEFGAKEIKENNFFYFFDNNNVCKFSNLNKKNKSFLKIDLTKKIKIPKNSFNNVLIFNVLEHIKNINFSLEQIYRILKPNGLIIGSTPFIYRVHEAPKDYSRYTKDYLRDELRMAGFKKIHIKELGHGPFIASFSLLRGILKFIPIVYQLLFSLCYFVDYILIILLNTHPKKVYPIGFVFKAKK